MRRLLRRLFAGAAVAVTITSCADTASPDLPLVAPEGYAAPVWEELLGGDEPADASVWAQLDDPATSDLGADAGAARQVAAAVALAELTGAGRDPFTSYFAGVPHGVCDDVVLHAVSPMTLPTAADARFAKVLVAWTGSCPAVPLTDSGQPAVSYLLLVERSGMWSPVTLSQVPRPPKPTADVLVPEWALTSPACARDGVRLRVELAEVWDAMCEAAAADDVELLAIDGFRQIGEQSDRFAEAVERYGSVAAAERHVAYADVESCWSAHCYGAAVDVHPDPDAYLWLREPVGCMVDGAFVSDMSVCAGSPLVLRLHTFGWSAPVAANPMHLEWVADLVAVSDNTHQAECAPSDVNDVELVVEEVFTCRLTGLADTNQWVPDIVEAAACHMGVDGVPFTLSDATWIRFALPHTGRDVVEIVDVAARAAAHELSWGRDPLDLLGCVS